MHFGRTVYYIDYYDNHLRKRTMGVVHVREQKDEWQIKVEVTGMARSDTFGCRVFCRQDIGEVYLGKIELCNGAGKAVFYLPFGKCIGSAEKVIVLEIGKNRYGECKIMCPVNYEEFETKAAWMENEKLTDTEPLRQEPRSVESQEQIQDQKPESRQEQRPEQRSEQRQEQRQEQSPEQRQEQSPEQRQEQRQEQSPEQRPGQRQEQRPEQRQEQRQEQSPEQRQEQNSEIRREQIPDQRPEPRQESESRRDGVQEQDRAEQAFREHILDRERVNEIKEKLSRESEEERWQQAKLKFPSVHPFEDLEAYICISPQDLSILSAPYRTLENNSFLLHGFHSYRHLILGKYPTEQGDKFYIGVPGSFEEREQVMAGMFGFEGYEYSKNIGYYMKEVHL